MFGNNPSPNDREEEDPDDLFTTDPLDEVSFGGELSGGKNAPGDPARVPWQELPDETAEELEEEADSPMCEHDDSREVITKQSSAGATVAGTGVSATETISRIACPVCGREWDTQDGSDQPAGDGSPLF